MLDITKKAIKVISDRAYAEGKGVNYFNLLLEYCLRIVPIEESCNVDTAYVQFINNSGFVIRYNPKCPAIYNEQDDEDTYATKIAWFLAHEALHILFKHLEVPHKTTDNHMNMNIAMDSQINSYLYNNGYYDVFKNTLKHYTIVEIVKMFKSTDTKVIEGSPLGFEVETDMPDWEVMYKFLMDNVPEAQIETIGIGDLPGNYHSEFEKEASGPYVDRIFSGFAKAIDKDIPELDELMKKELNKKNPFFKMRKVKSEKLKSDWVRELGKCISGVNAHSSYKKTWNRFSRRLGEGFAGRTRDRYQDCSVLVDVSGSMTQDIPKAIRQICSIATFIGRIRYFLTWDTEQCGEWFNINANKLKRLEIGSRGGTLLGEGFKQLARKGRTKLLIVISDMETCEEDYKILNELSKTHKVILGLVQTDIHLAFDFFDHRVKVIPIAGKGAEEESED